MNVSLTPELEQLVQEKVASGLYQTASEVVRAALRLLKAHETPLRAPQRAARAGLSLQRRRGQGGLPRGKERRT